MYESNIGCPQGGRASPFLWRIGMNSLLKKMEKVNGIKAIAYADDLTRQRNMKKFL
jgi:hypothetical protein